jgi:tetratricopeptide (TPR) repeat protein
VSRDTETIGDRLRRLRLERGLSQRALAQRGVSYAYISRIEAGARTPSVKALRLLARRLGVAVEYLETGHELGDAESRELRLRDAELELRLSEDSGDAERLLETILAEAESVGDTAATVRALAALGLTAERRGDHRRAIGQLERALEIENPSVLDGWDVYRTLGRAYAAVGRADEAVRLFEGCIRELERVAPDDDVAFVRVATFLGAALSDAGDLPRARETVASALRRATGIADSHTRIRLYWSYARIALNEQRPRVALENLRRAVALLEATEDTRELARAHLFWAEILTFDDRAEEAAPHLGLAEELLGTHPDREDLALLRTEQARAAAETGRSDDALGYAREALELIGDGDRSDRATALWALGQAQVDVGELDAGVETLAASMERFEREQEWYEAATVARRLGQAYRKAGRESEALDVLERAVGYTTRADAGARRPSTLRA